MLWKPPLDTHAGDFITPENFQVSADEPLLKQGLQRRLLFGRMLGVAPWFWISSRIRSAS